jgi:hypothetical protein
MSTKLIVGKSAKAAKWISQAVEQHEGFVKAFMQAKCFALLAGVYLNAAKAEFEHGEWESFMEGYKSKLPIRTAQHYMAFATCCIEWARHENPNLVGMDKIIAAAKALVMQSPKPLVALCRDLRLMRPFGEYDEVKYRTKKLAGAQIEFNFTELDAAIDPLLHLGEDNYTFKFPEGVDSKTYITGFKTKLQAVLKRLDEMEAGQPIEV